MHPPADQEDIQGRAEQTDNQQDRQRDDVADHDFQLDGSDAESDQIIREGTAEMPDDRLGQIIIRLGLTQYGPDKDTGQEGAGEDRQHQGRPKRLHPLAQGVAQHGNQRNHCEVEGHRIQRDGRESRLTHAETPLFRQDSRAQFRGQVREASQIGRLSPFRTPTDHRHTDDHGSDDTDRCGRHRQGPDVLEPVFLKGLAQGRRRTVTAAETGRHRQTDRPVHRPDGRQDKEAQQAAQAPLQEHSGLGISPHPADLVTGPFALSGSQGQAAEYQRNQNAGIGPQLIR